MSQPEPDLTGSPTAKHGSPDAADGPRPALPTVEAALSFVNLVYPFAFAPPTFPRRIESLAAARWQAEGRELSVWEAQHFASEDLLRQVAEYVNPPEGALTTARLWRLEPNTLRSHRGLGGSAEWSLVLPGKSVPFQLVSVQLALFHLGLGLVTLQVKPVSDAMDDWHDFLHFVRYLRKPSSSRLRLRRRVGIDRATGEPQYEPYFPAAAGGAGAHPEGEGLWADIVGGLLESARLADEADGWWRELFVPGQMLPFAVLYLAGVAGGEQLRELYRIRNFFHARQEIYPSPDDLAPAQRGLLPYVAGQWFVFSLDGGAFVAFDAPDTPFFRQTLPDHLARQYYLLFVLTVHQRFILMMLSEEISRHWRVDNEDGRGADREAVFRRIHDSLLTFSACGYFSQAMQREHHHRYYCRWREVFQLAQLYDEVKQEVSEMHEYLLLRRTERLQDRTQRVEERLKQIALVLGPPALILAYLDAISEPAWLRGWGIAALLTVAGFLLGCVTWQGIHWLVTRHDRTG